LFKFFLKGRSLEANFLNHPGNFAQFSGHARLDNNSHGFASRDRGSGIDHISPVSQRDVLFVENQTGLIDGR